LTSFTYLYISLNIINLIKKAENKKNVAINKKKEATPGSSKNIPNKEDFVETQKITKKLRTIQETPGEEKTQQDINNSDNNNNSQSIKNNSDNNTHPTF
jgi:hypothetical protein